MNTKSGVRHFTIPSFALLALLVAVSGLPACSTKPKPTRAEVAVTKLDDLESSVRAVITDDARAKQVLALLDQMQSLMVAENKALADHDRRITGLLTNYATSDADLRSEFDAFNAARSQNARRAVGIVTRMRAATTAEEWSALQKARANALNAEANATRQD
jgi:uncharacterized membrane protein YqiK